MDSMLSPESLLDVRLGSVVAPAGHGKTELIARLAALGRRTLVLTHTHAGVHALRARIKRLGVDPKVAAVDTIASWSSRYTSSFPGGTRPSGRMPKGGEWTDIYKGGRRVLGNSAVRAVLEASYDRILVDEYQDCDLYQHALVKTLSNQLPTIVFGDRMQGIFNFSDSPSVSWDADVFPHFPLIGTLLEPMRWRSANVALGEWISEVRDKLERGHPIDLTTGPITFFPCENDYEVSPLFHDIDSAVGSIAAIHRYRKACDQLAKSTSGYFQAIEDIACKTLQEFAEVWDVASGPSRVERLRDLVKLAICKKKLSEGELESEDDLRVSAAIQSAYEGLKITGDARHAVSAIELIRKHSRARTFRGELVRDSLKSLDHLANGKFESLSQSVFFVRQRISHGGRFLPKRTVSTPLLLKGLEFDRVIVPDANHFNSGRETGDRAKLFYVALSRARSSLVVASSSPIVQFPIPT
ncbi:hypothetical protein XcmpCFBP7700_02970 [Xanthomonas campestris]|uniref:UvrD-helicase domain-containing protein n=2 Tax=Xanthomonas campestris TaxID=339 RepID=UPI000E7365D3|nr:hypothetical protein XcmpCFBP7700_02970 [Xanthomonas campestris]